MPSPIYHPMITFGLSSQSHTPPLSNITNLLHQNVRSKLQEQESKKRQAKTRLDEINAQIQNLGITISQIARERRQLRQAQRPTSELESQRNEHQQEVTNLHQLRRKEAARINGLQKEISRLQALLQHKPI